METPNLCPVYELFYHAIEGQNKLDPPNMSTADPSLAPQQPQKVFEDGRKKHNRENPDFHTNTTQL